MRLLTNLINQDTLARSMEGLSNNRSPLANYVKRDDRTNQRILSTGVGSTIAANYISNSTPKKVLIVSDGSYIDQRPA